MAARGMMARMVRRHGRRDWRRGGAKAPAASGIRRRVRGAGAPGAPRPSGAACGLRDPRKEALRRGARRELLLGDPRGAEAAHERAAAASGAACARPAPPRAAPRARAGRQRGRGADSSGRCKGGGGGQRKQE